jgi:hypothetical protein
MKEGLEPRWLGASYHIYSIAATNFTKKKTSLMLMTTRVLEAIP